MMKWIPNSHSQEGQESFVINQLKGKRAGYYVEIGGHHATELSNTYLLETQYNWSGVSLEIVKHKAELYNKTRKNPCLAVDATTYDLESYFIENEWPKQIDYLQVDIDPASDTLAALLNMPKEYRFSIITFEHDNYISPKNAKYQLAAYDFLSSQGYKRVVQNMKNLEDWYVDQNVIDCDFLGYNISPSDLFTFETNPGISEKSDIEGRF